jgi:deoxyinosine 3'endonuclease (endonuclease V)
MSLIDKDRLKELYELDPPLYSEAVSIQEELKDKVVSKNELSQVKTIAGADLAILKNEKKLVCGIIVFSYPELNEIERA